MEANLPIIFYIDTSAHDAYANTQYAERYDDAPLGRHAKTERMRMSVPSRILSCALAFVLAASLMLVGVSAMPSAKDVSDAFSSTILAPIADNLIVPMLTCLGVREQARADDYSADNTHDVTAYVNGSDITICQYHDYWTVSASGRYAADDGTDGAHYPYSIACAIVGKGVQGEFSSITVKCDLIEGDTVNAADGQGIFLRNVLGATVSVIEEEFDDGSVASPTCAIAVQGTCSLKSVSLTGMSSLTVDDGADLKDDTSGMAEGPDALSITGMGDEGVIGTLEHTDGIVTDRLPLIGGHTLKVQRIIVPLAVTLEDSTVHSFSDTDDDNDAHTDYPQIRMMDFFNTSARSDAKASNKADVTCTYKGDVPATISGAADSKNAYDDSITLVPGCELKMEYTYETVPYEIALEYGGKKIHLHENDKLSVSTGPAISAVGTSGIDMQGGTLNVEPRVAGISPASPVSLNAGAFMRLAGGISRLGYDAGTEGTCPAEVALDSASSFAVSGGYAIFDATRDVVVQDPSGPQTHPVSAHGRMAADGSSITYMQGSCIRYGDDGNTSDVVSSTGSSLFPLYLPQDAWGCSVYMDASFACDIPSREDVYAACGSNAISYGAPGVIWASPGRHYLTFYTNDGFDTTWDAVYDVLSYNATPQAGMSGQDRHSSYVMPSGTNVSPDVSGGEDDLSAMTLGFAGSRYYVIGWNGAGVEPRALTATLLMRSPSGMLAQYGYNDSSELSNSFKGNSIYNGNPSSLSRDHDGVSHSAPIMMSNDSNKDEASYMPRMMASLYGSMSASNRSIIVKRDTLPLSGFAWDHQYYTGRGTIEWFVNNGVGEGDVTATDASDDFYDYKANDVDVDEAKGDLDATGDFSIWPLSGSGSHSYEADHGVLTIVLQMLGMVIMIAAGIAGSVFTGGASAVAAFQEAATYMPLVIADAVAALVAFALDFAAMPDDIAQVFENFGINVASIGFDFAGAPSAYAARLVRKATDAALNVAMTGVEGGARLTIKEVVSDSSKCADIAQAGLEAMAKWKGAATIADLKPEQIEQAIGVVRARLTAVLKDTSGLSKSEYVKAIFDMSLNTGVKVMGDKGKEVMRYASTIMSSADIDDVAKQAFKNSAYYRAAEQYVIHSKGAFQTKYSAALDLLNNVEVSYGLGIARGKTLTPDAASMLAAMTQYASEACTLPSTEAKLYKRILDSCGTDSLDQPMIHELYGDIFLADPSYYTQDTRRLKRLSDTYVDIVSSGRYENMDNFFDFSKLQGAAGSVEYYRQVASHIAYNVAAGMQFGAVKLGETDTNSIALSLLAISHMSGMGDETSKVEFLSTLMKAFEIDRYDGPGPAAFISACTSNPSGFFQQPGNASIFGRAVGKLRDAEYLVLVNTDWTNQETLMEFVRAYRDSFGQEAFDVAQFPLDDQSKAVVKNLQDILREGSLTPGYKPDLDAYTKLSEAFADRVSGENDLDALSRLLKSKENSGSNSRAFDLGSIYMKVCKDKVNGIPSPRPTSKIVETISGHASDGIEAFDRIVGATIRNDDTYMERVYWFVKGMCSQCDQGSGISHAVFLYFTLQPAFGIFMDKGPEFKFLLRFLDDADFADPSVVFYIGGAFMSHHAQYGVDGIRNFTNKLLSSQEVLDALGVGTSNMSEYAKKRYAAFLYGVYSELYAKAARVRGSAYNKLARAMNTVFVSAQQVHGITCEDIQAGAFSLIAKYNNDGTLKNFNDVVGVMYVIGHEFDPGQIEPTYGWAASIDEWLRRCDGPIKDSLDDRIRFMWVLTANYDASRGRFSQEAWDYILDYVTWKYFGGDAHVAENTLRRVLKGGPPVVPQDLSIHDLTRYITTKDPAIQESYSRNLGKETQLSISSISPPGWANTQQTPLGVHQQFLVNGWTDIETGAGGGILNDIKSLRPDLTQQEFSDIMFDLYSTFPDVQMVTYSCKPGTPQYLQLCIEGTYSCMRMGYNPDDFNGILECLENVRNTVTDHMLGSGVRINDETLTELYYVMYDAIFHPQDDVGSFAWFLDDDNMEGIFKKMLRNDFEFHEGDGLNASEVNDYFNKFAERSNTDDHAKYMDWLQPDDDLRSIAEYERFANGIATPAWNDIWLKFKYTWVPEYFKASPVIGESLIAGSTEAAGAAKTIYNAGSPVGLITAHMAFLAASMASHNVIASSSAGPVVTDTYMGDVSHLDNSILRYDGNGDGKADTWWTRTALRDWSFPTAYERSFSGAATIDPDGRQSALLSGLTNTAKVAGATGETSWLAGSEARGTYGWKSAEDIDDVGKGHNTADYTGNSADLVLSEGLVDDFLPYAYVRPALWLSTSDMLMLSPEGALPSRKGTDTAIGGTPESEVKDALEGDMRATFIDKDSNADGIGDTTSLKSITSASVDSVAFGAQGAESDTAPSVTGAVCYVQSGSSVDLSWNTPRNGPALQADDMYSYVMRVPSTGEVIYYGHVAHAFDSQGAASRSGTFYMPSADSLSKCGIEDGGQVWLSLFSERIGGPDDVNWTSCPYSVPITVSYATYGGCANTVDLQGRAYGFVGAMGDGSDSEPGTYTLLAASPTQRETDIPYSDVQAALDSSDASAGAGGAIVKRNGHTSWPLTRQGAVDLLGATAYNGTASMASASSSTFANTYGTYTGWWIDNAGYVSTEPGPALGKVYDADASPALACARGAMWLDASDVAFASLAGGIADTKDTGVAEWVSPGWLLGNDGEKSGPDALALSVKDDTIASPYDVSVPVHVQTDAPLHITWRNPDVPMADTKDAYVGATIYDTSNGDVLYYAHLGTINGSSIPTSADLVMPSLNELSSRGIKAKGALGLRLFYGRHLSDSSIEKISGAYATTTPCLFTVTSAPEGSKTHEVTSADSTSLLSAHDMDATYSTICAWNSPADVAAAACAYVYSAGGATCAPATLAYVGKDVPQEGSQDMSADSMLTYLRSIKSPGIYKLAFSDEHGAMLCVDLNVTTVSSADGTYAMEAMPSSTLVRTTSLSHIASATGLANEFSATSWNRANGREDCAIKLTGITPDDPSCELVGSDPYEKLSSVKDAGYYTLTLACAYDANVYVECKLYVPRQTGDIYSLYADTSADVGVSRLQAMESLDKIPSLFNASATYVQDDEYSTGVVCSYVTFQDGITYTDEQTMLAHIKALEIGMSATVGLACEGEPEVVRTCTLNATIDEDDKNGEDENGGAGTGAGTYRPLQIGFAGSLWHTMPANAITDGMQGVATTDVLALLSDDPIVQNMYNGRTAWANDMKSALCVPYTKSHVAAAIDTYASSLNHYDASAIYPRVSLGNARAAATYSASDDSAIYGTYPMWALSSQEASALPASVVHLSSATWVRTSLYGTYNANGNVQHGAVASYMGDNGSVNDTADDGQRSLYVRPATLIDTSRIAFVSAESGALSKVAAAGMAARRVYASIDDAPSPARLTVSYDATQGMLSLSSAPTDVALAPPASSVYKPSDTVAVSWAPSASAAGDNMWVSYELTCENSADVYYGKLADISNGDSGHGVMVLPGGMSDTSSYDVRVFYEHIGGSVDIDAVSSSATGLDPIRIGPLGTYTPGWQAGKYKDDICAPRIYDAQSVCDIEGASFIYRSTGQSAAPTWSPWPDDPEDMAPGTYEVRPDDRTIALLHAQYGSEHIPDTYLTCAFDITSPIVDNTQAVQQWAYDGTAHSVIVSAYARDGGDIDITWSYDGCTDPHVSPALTHVQDGPIHATYTIKMAGNTAPMLSGTVDASVMRAQVLPTYEGESAYTYTGSDVSYDASHDVAYGVGGEVLGLAYTDDSTMSARDIGAYGFTVSGITAPTYIPDGCTVGVPDDYTLADDTQAISRTWYITGAGQVLDGTYGAMERAGFVLSDGVWEYVYDKGAHSPVAEGAYGDRATPSEVSWYADAEYTRPIVSPVSVSHVDDGVQSAYYVLSAPSSAPVAGSITYSIVATRSYAKWQDAASGQGVAGYAVYPTCEVSSDSVKAPLSSAVLYSDLGPDGEANTEDDVDMGANPPTSYGIYMARIVSVYETGNPATATDYLLPANAQHVFSIGGAKGDEADPGAGDGVGTQELPIDPGSDSQPAGGNVVQGSIYAIFASGQDGTAVDTTSPIDAGADGMWSATLSVVQALPHPASQPTWSISSADADASPVSLSADGTLTVDASALPYSHETHITICVTRQGAGYADKSEYLDLTFCARASYALSASVQDVTFDIARVGDTRPVQASDVVLTNTGTRTLHDTICALTSDGAQVFRMSDATHAPCNVCTLPDIAPGQSYTLQLSLSDRALPNTLEHSVSYVSLLTYAIEGADPYAISVSFNVARAIVTSSSVSGIIQPRTGSAPDHTGIASNGLDVADIAWSPDTGDAGVFSPNTEYTIGVRLVPDADHAIDSAHAPDIDIATSAADVIQESPYVECSPDGSYVDVYATYVKTDMSQVSSIWARAKGQGKLAYDAGDSLQDVLARSWDFYATYTGNAHTTSFEHSIPVSAESLMTQGYIGYVGTSGSDILYASDTGAEITLKAPSGALAHSDTLSAGEVSLGTLRLNDVGDGADMANGAIWSICDMYGNNPLIASCDSDGDDMLTCYDDAAVSYIPDAAYEDEPESVKKAFESFNAHNTMRDDYMQDLYSYDLILSTCLTYLHDVYLIHHAQDTGQESYMTAKVIKQAESAFSSALKAATSSHVPLVQDASSITYTSSVVVDEKGQDATVCVSGDIHGVDTGSMAYVGDKALYIVEGASSEDGLPTYALYDDASNELASIVSPYATIKLYASFLDSLDDGTYALTLPFANPISGTSCGTCAVVLERGGSAHATGLVGLAAQGISAAGAPAMMLLPGAPKDAASIASLAIGDAYGQAAIEASGAPSGILGLQNTYSGSTGSWMDFVNSVLGIKGSQQKDASRQDASRQDAQDVRAGASGSNDAQDVRVGVSGNNGADAYVGAAHVDTAAAGEDAHTYTYAIVALIALMVIAPACALLFVFRRKRASSVWHIDGKEVDVEKDK